VRDNIAYGRPDARDADVVAAAKMAAAHDFIQALPRGYDTVLGEGGATISEGEKLRLTIARAMLRAAPILNLDEPTAALDAETEAVVMQALARLGAGRTCVIIAHRLSTARTADRIVVLRAGRIVEIGSFDELMRRDGAFAALYRRQFGRETSVSHGGA
jgi:ATP-binding cassette subfamily B protein/subfamily B ATP-binding cassette protein MsbA